MKLILDIKKKINELEISWALFLFLLLIYTPIYSCDLDKITAAHSSVLAKLGFPQNSLLSISNNELSIIADEIIMNIEDSKGSKEIYLYQQSSDRLILKGIALTDFNPTLLKYLETLNSSQFDQVFINRDGIYVLIDDINENGTFSCYSKIFMLKSSLTNISKAPTQLTIEERTKNKIISNLLNSKYHLDTLANELNLTFSSHENHNDLAQKIHNLRQTTEYANKLIIKPERAGAQISEIHIPITSYDRALKFKDENELFYLTSFKISKKPKLVKSKPMYHFDLISKGNQNFMNINSNFDFSDILYSNAGFEYKSSNLKLSTLFLGLKKFSSQQFLNSFYLGKFSSWNTGLLIKADKLNKNESLINATIYLGSQSLCNKTNKCTKNGFSVSFEKYFFPIDGYTEANLNVQNFRHKSKKTLGLLIRKPLSNKKQLTFSAQYDLVSKDPNIFVKLAFPLNSNNSVGSISYMHEKEEYISDWAGGSNRSLLENTPSFMKRNWKNYINF